MSDTKFFKVPFAVSGDVSPIPDPAQVDGSMSYTAGYPIDYELDPATDPDAKRIERDKMNALFFDITSNLLQYQTWGNPQFVTTAQNGGTPVSYGKGAFVLYDAGAGLALYGSLVANNTVLPGSDPTKWLLADPFSLSLIAVAADYITPSSNGLLVSPGRLSTALREGRLTYAAATRVGGAYSLALPGSTFTYVVGGTIEFTVPDASPAGPLTMKCGALATVPLQSNTETDPAAGDLQPNRTYTAKYSGSKFLIVQSLPSQLLPPLVLPDRLAATTASVAASADLNTALSNGWYGAAAGVTNGPSALAAVALRIEVAATDANNVVQTATGVTGGSEATTVTYQRFRIAGTFGPWFRIYSSATEVQQVALAPGIIGHTAGSSAPNGWLVRDGSAVSRTTYAALFAVIGTTWGAGNGTTTFNLPDALTDGYFDRAGTPDGANYADTVGEHLHLVAPTPRNSEGGSGFTVTGNSGIGETLTPYNTELHNPGGETTPKHQLYLPIIKY